MAAELAIIAKLQDEASSGIRALRGEIEGVGESGGIAAKGFQSLQTVGAVALTALAGAVTLAAGATALFVKSAISAGIEFESAFAGVIKTVDGVVDAGGNLTAFGEELRESFRQLALEIPVAVTELAKIGELGGQLGVAGEDLIDFTRLIAQLGVTTNLSVEEAAMSFAQFGNIMQSSQDDLARFGSAVVWLGNNFATTEADIVAFSTRIAGAGAIAGMTEADLAGIGAAFSSVGVQAEAGGTAVQKVLIDINTSVAMGGSQLEKYAQAAGMTAEQFAAAWRNDPGQAFTSFVEGLGKAGDNAVLILDDLGLADARLVRAFLSVAGAGDLLGRAIEGSNQAFIDNMALAREAALRFQTVESQMQLFKNVVNDVKIALYDALRPAIVAIIGALTTLIASVAPQARAIFEAVGAAVGQFVTALLQGEAPIGALIDALFRLAEELGVPVEHLAALRTQLDGFMTAVGSVLGPIAQAIVSFVSWKDVLTVLAISIASVVIPILFAIVQAVAPLIAVFGGLVLAVAALRNAWETDFLGIRTAVEGLIDVAVLLVGAFVDSFQDSGDLIGSLVVAFQNLVGPTTAAGESFLQIGEKVRDFIAVVQGLFQPTIERIREAFGSLGENMAPVGEKLGQLKDAFVGLGQALMPVVAVIGAAVGIIAKFLGEVLAGIVNNAGVILGGLVTFVTGIVQGVTNAVQSLVDIVRALLTGDWAGAWEAAKGFVAGWVEATKTQLSGLLQIVDGIMGALWDAVVNTINDLTGATLPSWDSFKQAAVDAFNNLVETVRNALTPLAEFFGPTIDRIKEAVASLGESFAPVGEKLSGLKDAFDRLGEALQPIFNIFQQFATFVGTVFVGVLQGVATVIGAVIAVIAKLLGEVLAGIISNAATIIGGLVAAVTGVVQGITSSVQAIVDFVRAALQGDWAAAWQAAGSYVTGMVESVKTILGGLLTAVDGILGALWNAVVNTINDLTGASVASWDQFKAAVVEKFGQIKDSIAAAVGEWRQAIVDKITEIGSSISSTVDSWKQAFSDSLSQIKDAISSKVEEWKQAFVSFGDGVKSINVGESIRTTIVDGIATIADSIRQKVAEWVDSFKSFIENVRSINIGQAIVDFIVDGLASFMTKIGTTLSGWLQAFTNWVNGINWYDVGYTIVDFIIKALVEFPREVADTLKEWGQAFVDWASDTASDLADTGEAIIEAVIEGLKEFPGMVADTLREWGQAFLDWASSTATELKDTGQAIIEAVIEGLKEFPGMVADTLREWGQAFLDWASSTATELKDTGQAIIEAVIEGLKEFPGMVADTLREWGQAFLDWASSTATELQDTGQSIIQAIITGLQEFPAMVASTLQTWLSAFAQWVGNSIALLVIIGRAIVTHIVTGLADFWTNAVTTVSGWFTSLSTYIGGKVAELTALGRSIVDGLVAGVVAAGAALAAAAGGVVSGAIAAVRAALGNPHSPAPALIPLGSSISEGLAYGISQSAGLVVSAIQEVATSTEIAGIKEFTEALKSIAEAMAPAMAAIVMILAFDPGDATGLAAAVAKVAELVRIIVSGFTAANDQTDEALAAVGEFVSAGSSIVDLIGQSMGIMAQLAAITLPDVNGAMLENLARLRDFVASLVAGFGLAAVELSALSPIVKDFADAASSVIDLIEQALPAIAALYAVDLSKYTASYHLADQMIIFRKVIKELVKQFIDSAAEFSYMSDAVQSFTDAASSIVDLIAQALPVIAVLFSADLSKYVSSYHLADQMIIFRKVIKELVKQFIDSAAEFAFMSDAVQSFVAAAESVIGLIDQALPAIATLFSADLSKYVADYHLANQMVIFRKVIRELVNQFSMAAAEFSFMSDEVIRLADAAGSILDLLTQTMDVMGQVAGFTGFGGDISGRLTLLGEMLVSIVVTLANSLAAASAQSGAAITAAAALADSVGQLLDVVEAGVDALAALSTFAPIAGIQTAAMTFANQLVAVLQELAGAFSTAATNAGAAINQAAEFADQAADILDVVEPGLEALAALSTFVPIAGIREEARAFAYQLVAILRELAGEFSTAAANAGAAIAQAAEFADRAGDILDVIEPGLDALAALSTFVPIAGIRLEAMAFASQLVAVLQELAGAFSTAAVNAGAAITEAAEFADRAGDILDVVEPGLEALMGLASYVSTTGINAAVQSFAADLVLVVQALGTAFAAASTALGAAADQAASFADSAKDIVDVVEPGIEALSALAGYVSASGVRERTQQFAADLVTVITALANGLAASGLAANQAVTEAAALADKLTQILDVVKPGVEALSALADYTSGANLQAKTQQFTADLISVTQALVTGLTQSALAAGTALAQAGIMAQNISKLFEVIVPALEALEALAAYSAASDVRANAAQFTDDLVAVANTLVTGLNQAATSMGQGAIAAAQAFAAAVTGIVKEVDAAMNGLVALAGLPTPPIEPTLNYIVQSSQQITSSFSAAGDIGAAVVYAANFRLNLIQLVQEVQGAVAQIAALAGTSTSGSIGGALAAIANAMSNTVGQFSGAGQQLAAAFTEAIKTGIVAGAAPAAVSTSMVIGAAISAGTTVAKGGVAVGIALIAAITSGVSSGQNSVVNAVVQVVNAAISAGLNEAKKAGSIGQEVIRAALAEINAGRSSLDSAGSAAGSAIIDGMVRAISSGQSRLVNAIKAAVSAAVAAAKAALGIASPSKVALALMGNFMKTAAGALGDPRGLVSAVDQSMTRMVGVAAHRLAQSQLAAPVAMPMASLAGGISPRIYPMPETGSGRSIVTAGGGDFNLTININGGDHSLSDIKRQVQQAVSDAMAQQGRRADAVRRMR